MYAFVAHTFFGVVPSHLRAVWTDGLQLSQERAQPLHCGLLYYLHVPKTGGTTVKNHLHALGPQGWQLLSLQWPQKEKNTTERQRWLDDPEHWKTSEGWRRLRDAIATEERPKLLMVAHHGAPGLAYMVEHELPKLACELKSRGCGVAVTTMLREPVERAVSAALFNAAKSGRRPERALLDRSSHRRRARPRQPRRATDALLARGPPRPVASHVARAQPPSRRRGAGEAGAAHPLLREDSRRHRAARCLPRGD